MRYEWPDWVLAKLTPQYRTMFSKEVGEHYQLLAYLSHFHELALDAATFHGASALAMAMGCKVRTCDIQDRLLFWTALDYPHSVMHIPLDDLRQFDLILIDLFHDGEDEERFLRRIVESGFHGEVVLDDIYLNRDMERFWKNIRFQKTELEGHDTGTGILWL